MRIRPKSLSVGAVQTSSQPTFTADGIHLAFMSGMNLVVFVNTLSDTEESSITLPPPPFEPIRNFSFFFVPKP